MISNIKNTFFYANVQKKKIQKKFKKNGKKIQKKFTNMGKKFTKVKNKTTFCIKNNLKLSNINNNSPISLSILYSFLILPSIGYYLLIRNSEKINKEDFTQLNLAFLWGSIPSIILTLLIRTPIDIFLQNIINPASFLGNFISACVLAPTVEEFTKGLGLLGFKKNIDEKEDGLIYSSIIGLGFATIENFFYSASVSPIANSIILVILRQLTSSVGHMLFTSRMGCDFFKFKNENIFSNIIPSYNKAVLFHFIHNFVATVISFLPGNTTAAISLLQLAGYVLFYFRARINLKNEIMKFENESINIKNI